MITISLSILGYSVLFYCLYRYYSERDLSRKDDMLMEADINWRCVLVEFLKANDSYSKFDHEICRQKGSDAPVHFKYVLAHSKPSNMMSELINITESLNPAHWSKINKLWIQKCKEMYNTLN